MSAQWQFAWKDSKHKPVRFHYVPIKDTLRTMWEDSSVQTNLQCFDEPNGTVTVLNDFKDGSVYKSNIFFRLNKSHK